MPRTIVITIVTITTVLGKRRTAVAMDFTSVFKKSSKDVRQNDSATERG
jgi:hypothetical protein